MRPRSADTSEPACTKRKMLSMKSSTSWPASSRKYSAIVRPLRPTRRRAPGGSFICPYTSAVLSMTPLSFISSQRSLPSRVRSPTPANTDRPPCSWAMLLISSWMSTVLPTPAPPKRPTLPPFTYGREQVNDLDAGLEDLLGGVELVERRGLAVDRPALGRPDVAALVDRLAEHVEDAAERHLADGHRDRPAGVGDRRAAREPVGGVERDRAHAVVAQVLLDLGDAAAGRRRRGRSPGRCRSPADPRRGSGRR